MKHQRVVIVFAVLALLLFNILFAGLYVRSVKADAQKTIVQFYDIGGGQASLTNETTHTSPFSAKLMIPSSVPQESGCMVLYPYNKTLSSLQSFQVYTSYSDAVPSLVVRLDTNGDGLTDVALLSDYQYPSNGSWQLTQAGQRWGWTEAYPDLSTYGKTWSNFSYWQGVFGNATVLSIGVALEYWSVKDSGGLDQPLYADELVLNGVTYDIGSVSTQPAPPTSSQTAGAVLDTRLNGQALITNETVHTDPYSVKLVIPPNAAQDSAAMALYPYNKSLNSIASFSVWASFTTAVPRFVIYLDTNSDGLTDVILLSDYQIVSNGQWQICTGGNRWGWTQANTQLSDYGKTWNQLCYWKNQYPNSTVLFIGIALEYWAVHDQGGINQPLYADELILNGLTYNLTSASNQLPSAKIDYWTMYRHDLQCSGVSTSPAPNCDLIWRFFTGPSTAPSLADRLRASPTVADGVVYIGSNNSYFYALNATTGSPIWQVNVGSNVESSATVVDGVVYVGILWNGYNGYVDALNATNGAIIWRFATNSGVESSPAVVNGVVYIGSFYGYVYALNAANGTLKWSYLTGGSTFSSPAVVGGTVYIGSIDGKVYALNASTGTVVWFFHTGDQVYSSPVVVNNVIYIASDNGTVFALNANDGSEIWQVSIGKSDHTDDSPAVAGGVVYVGTRNGYYAFNATNGSQIWFFTSPYSPRQFTGYVYSSPAVAGNVVYFGSFDSYVFALNASDGSIVWSYHTGGFLFSSPAVANGVLYIGSYDGNVYALGTMSAPTSTPTPTPTLQPLPSSTPAPTVKPVPVNTTHPNSTPITTPAPPPAQLPSQDPPISTNQPPARPILVIEPNQNGSADWLILGAIILTGAIALISLVVIFKKSD